jgi:hypothetical protein
MSQLRYNCSEASSPGAVCMAMVMVLCFLVVVQILGVPVTLLSPPEVADTVAGSVLGGGSIPPSLSQLMASFETISVTDAQAIVHTPVLVSTLFHPPVRKFRFHATHQGWIELRNHMPVESQARSAQRNANRSFHETSQSPNHMSLRHTGCRS